MNESCDRCGPGTRAAYRADKAGLTLALCGHCTLVHNVVLAARGWLITLLTSPVPQLSEVHKGSYWVDAPS
jgi:hypothetical protein